MSMRSLYSMSITKTIAIPIARNPALKEILDYNQKK